MGLITVIRHGQASPFGQDYDQLSPRGEQQSRLLGAHWAALGVQWDRVLVGPRRRHHQTEQLVGAEYRARGLPWPAPEPMAELDELEMAPIAAYFAGRTAADRQDRLRLQEVPEHQRAQALKKAFARLGRALEEFATTGVEIPGVESWVQFRSRAGQALDALAASGRSRRVLAFSSGGLTGMLVGNALGLTDQQAIALMMQVRNSSFSSLLYAPERRSLLSFNSVPHLPPELWTIG